MSQFLSANIVLAAKSIIQHKKVRLGRQKHEKTKEVPIDEKGRFVCSCEEQPALFGSTALYALLNAVIPYITLWFTAQILNELAGTSKTARAADTENRGAACGGECLITAKGGCSAVESYIVGRVLHEII